MLLNEQNPLTSWYLLICFLASDLKRSDLANYVAHRKVILDILNYAIQKGEGYPIEAICGGMAICGTCKVEVLNKDEILLEGANDDELCMLDTLPCNTGNCRLTWQIQISEKINKQS